MEDYLHKERVFKEGDLIAVSSRSAVDCYEYFMDSFKFTWPIIYYKVIQVDNQAQIFSNTSTKWGVYSSLSSTLPPRIEDYLSKNLRHFVRDSSVDKLSSIILPYFTQLKDRVPTILISGPSASGKQSICFKIALLWNMHFFEINCEDIIGEGIVTTCKNLRTQLEKIINYQNCMVYLHSIDLLFIDPDDSKVLDCINGILIDYYSSRDPGHTFALIASTTKPSFVLESEIGTIFNHHLSVNLPDDLERRKFLTSLTSSCSIDAEDYNILTKETKGFNFDEMMTLLAKVERRQLLSKNQDCYSFDYDLDLKAMNKKITKSSGAVSIPNIDWSDIGGLETAKKEIVDIFQVPLEYPNLIRSGLRRCGILLYGPPGTGKTLLAKAVASQCMLNFLNVKGPELMCIYVGESEANVREIFNKAKKSRPSVIFFDELDSIAPKRGKFGDSGGVMDRIVSQLVTEIDLISSYEDIFIIGATNRPDLLDSALLIPGRFDRLVYVGPPKDSKSRISILKALTKKFNLSEDVNLTEIETMCPPNLTGADFYSICSMAMMLALNRSVEHIELGELNEEEATINVKFCDFTSALSNFSPSLTPKELVVYENIQLSMASKLNED